MTNQEMGVIEDLRQQLQAETARADLNEKRANENLQAGITWMEKHKSAMAQLQDAQQRITNQREEIKAITRQRDEAQAHTDTCRQMKNEAEARAEKAEQDIQNLGIIELAVRNTNVASYVEQWEGRAMKAESELASLKAGEGWIPIARRIVSAKNLYCDHNPGDPCDICALEAVLPPAPAKPAEGPAAKECQ